MKAGQSDDGYSKDLLDIIKFTVAAFIVVLVFVWISILLALAGITTWPSVETNAVLFLFVLSIALICAALWVSHHLGAIKLAKETEGRIWKTLISAILLAVVGAIARMFRG